MKIFHPLWHKIIQSNGIETRKVSRMRTIVMQWTVYWWNYRRAPSQLGYKLWRFDKRNTTAWVRWWSLCWFNMCCTYSLLLASGNPWRGDLQKMGHMCAARSSFSLPVRLQWLPWTCTSDISKIKDYNYARRFVLAFMACMCECLHFWVITLSWSLVEHCRYYIADTIVSIVGETILVLIAWWQTNCPE